MAEKRKFTLHDGKSGAAIAVRVTTRASKNEITGIQDNGTLKIRIKAAPVEGKANQALIEFLSELIGIPKSSIEIVSGLSGKDKLVTVMGITAEQLHSRLLVHIKK
jgi:uncharacterized protein (TIGR00251 family)